MSKEMQTSLQDLHEELGKIDHEESQTLREQIANFVHQLGDESEDLREDLLTRLIEAQDTFQDNYPVVSATLRRAIDIMSNAGV